MMTPLNGHDNDFETIIEHHDHNVDDSAEEERDNDTGDNVEADPWFIAVQLEKDGSSISFTTAAATVWEEEPS